MKDVRGWRAVLVNKYVATLVTVGLGMSLGFGGYAKIWPLFGAANQLLAALALLAVACWLQNLARRNGMFLLPMLFMLLVTLSALVLGIVAQGRALLAGTAGPWQPCNWSSPCCCWRCRWCWCTKVGRPCAARGALRRKRPRPVFPSIGWRGRSCL